jgi:hypothetical protein
MLTQSRWGYQNLSVMEDVVRGYKDADIPLEVSCDVLEWDDLVANSDISASGWLYERQCLTGNC